MKSRFAYKSASLKFHVPKSITFENFLKFHAAKALIDHRVDMVLVGAVQIIDMGDIYNKHLYVENSTL